MRLFEHIPGGLRTKLALVFALVSVSLAALGMAYSGQRLASTYRDSARSELAAIARSFGKDFNASDLRQPRLLKARIRGLEAVNPGLRDVSVYGRSGSDVGLVVSTEEDAGRGTTRPLRTGRPEYAEETSGGIHMGVLAFPLRDRGRPVAVLELDLDLTGLDQSLAEQRRAGTLVAVLQALVLALVLILLLGRLVLGPIGKLRDATRVIRSGETGARLGWQRSDELGDLARDFDAMAERLEGTQQRLEALAFMDALTGLPNLRGFQDRLRGELGRAEREGYPVSVIALDLDRFKSVNDDHGHGTGDEALRLLAHAILSELRPSDMCGRVGGDEFLVALPRTGSDLALEIASRLQAGLSLVAVGPLGLRLTFSAGVAEFPAHSTEQTDLVRMADAAMYSAKGEGRDRVTVYEPDGSMRFRGP